jgi:type II secretory pathway pseudopilin PulG
MKIIKLKQKNKGFTLVETLVGISILIIAITATFTAAQSGLSSSIESKDQVIAYFLAQEAVEAVRNLRDDNALATRHWLSGFSENASDVCYFGKSCVYDGQLRTFTTCPTGPGSCENLKQNNNSESSTYGMYAYGDSSWRTTNFRREIEVESINSNEITLTVTVYWSKGIFTRSFVVNESILNWQ